MGKTKQINKIRTKADLESLVPGEAVDIRIESALWHGESVYVGRKKTTSLRMIFINQKYEQIGEVVIDPDEGDEKDGYYVLTNHKSTNIIMSEDRDFQGYFQLLKKANLWKDN